MLVIKKSISELMEDSNRLGRDGFLQVYPGTFLWAMGFLSAEVLRSAQSEDTSALFFSSQKRHDVSQAHPLAGFAFFLKESDESSEIMIGRGADCDLNVPEDSVTTHHCTLRYEDDEYWLTDKSSRNGTSINMDKLTPNQPMPVVDEDIITIGRYSFQFFNTSTLFAALQLLQTLEE